MTTIPPALQLALTVIIALSALIGCAFAVTTFFRQGGWKRREEHDAETTRIEGKLLMVDLEARKSIQEVEKSVIRVEGKIDVEIRAVLARMEAGDGDLRNALQGLRSALAEARRSTDTRLTGIEEHVRHLPTNADLMKIVEQMATNRGLIGETAAKVEGTQEMVRTIRDHLMRERA